jgi:hypothetical protein
LALILLIISASCNAAPIQYDAVFSGLVISTQTLPEPSSAPDLRFWTKSKILVLHIWQGAPSTITEVWTPGGSSCDQAILAGFHFVALARNENDRLIAHNSDCENDVVAAATQGRGTYTKAAVTLIAAAFLVTAVVLTWSVISIRQLRRSPAASQRLPVALCFFATILPVAPAIYLIGFQNVVAAITILVIALFWSKLLAHLSMFDAWKRNAGWLLASVIGVLGIALIPIKFDIGSRDVGLLGTPAALGFWFVVAVAVLLTVLLLNALRVIHSRIQR